MALEAHRLVVSIADKTILRGVDIRVDKGQVVALMGPNGSGKTTLAYALIGHPSYRIVDGKVLLDGEDITHLPPEERAKRGLLLGFQDPVEIPGLSLVRLILAAYSKLQGLEELLHIDPNLMARIREVATKIGLRSELLYRGLNVGFSGGEKKRSEILQLLVLRPKYAILDEPDSGLDIDGLKTIVKAIDELRENGAGILLITHYTRILKYLEVDKVLVMINGVIVDEGGVELAERIDKEGYGPYINKLASQGG